MSVAPKRPKGPPLNAMRAFEAAARHVSFVAAAEELNVSAGAISQHVKTLEGWAGTPLFRRNAQGVTLTSAGADLLPMFTVAFDELADATHALRNLRPDTDFHIAALPALAQLWLPRRLARVRTLFPQINFSVTAMETPPSLSRELFDLSLFIGVPEPAENQISICRDEIVPVCAPSVLTSFEDFNHCALLHDQVWIDDWRLWSETVGVKLHSPQKGAHFSLYSLAVEETKAGAGILMGHLPLIEEALASGTLVRADERSCTTGRFILMNLPHTSRQRSETRQIALALSEEVNRS
ncbi:LysR family transcriptional regulator [Aliiroseovarius sp. F20344]|uniref:LysR family transcriptional regulator n=1 Tax=Aliiroseovarius sp. F20344 TaxID=2926414 RepID=UPI001FF4E288|nr:LysR family transcriptional regulator [Aliiroseovarius sp. F20344]MCK0141052.1 LysR family transcriptional regulator [Aliiroseovarius sp. F20344]